MRNRIQVFVLLALLTACNSAAAQYRNYSGTSYQKCTPAYCPPAYVSPPPPVYVPPPVLPPQSVVINHAPPQNNLYLIGIPVPVQSYQPIAAQGKSLYTYSAASGPYPYFDPALFQQQSAKALENAQALAQSANSDFHAASTTMRENDAAIERIRVASEAISRIQETPAAQGATTRDTETFTSSSSSKAYSGNSQASEPIQAQSLQQNSQSGSQDYRQIDRVLKSRCVACHDKYASGWAALPVGDKGKVFLRINHPDPAKRMPLAADKQSPGKPLTDKEKLVFLK